MTASERARELVQAAAVAADAKQAEDIVALDVSDMLPFADAFLITSARNERLVQAVSDAIEEALLPLGARPLRREGKGDGRWILIDFGDLIVHVFHDEERTYYSLERLWRDCPVIPVSLPEAPVAERA